jgi:hypothetical protein
MNGRILGLSLQQLWKSTILKNSGSRALDASLEHLLSERKKNEAGFRHKNSIVLSNEI